MISTRHLNLRSPFKLAAVGAALVLTTAACGGQVDTSGGGQTGAGAPVAAAGGKIGSCPDTIDAKKHEPTSPVGLGPRGEKPAAPETVNLTPEEAAKAKAAQFKVGIAMQTEDIDYSKILIRSMSETFAKYGVKVLQVTDGQWSVTKQQSDIQNLIALKPDGIVSVPTDSVGMASTYKTVQQNGIKLVMLDDTPQGMAWPKDVSATSGMDQKGMGQIAMSILAECIPKGGTVGMVKIDIVLWAANQREEGAREWLKKNRPDIKLKTIGVTNPNDVAQRAGDFITANPDVQGLWTPWDGPGLQALASLRGMGSTIPVTTQDLGTQFGLNIATGSQLIGGGAQLLNSQGAMHAQTLIKAMLGEKLPEYVAEPAIAVTKSNLTDAWTRVWGSPPPKDIADACKKTPGCR